MTDGAIYLSPSHSLFIDGFLIPVEMLVNDRQITTGILIAESKASDTNRRHA
jgi:hypothetical protein